MEVLYESLIKFLKKDIKKNGIKPLTNLQLLAILRRAREEDERIANQPDLDFDPNYDRN